MSSQELQLILWRGKLLETARGSANHDVDVVGLSFKETNSNSDAHQQSCVLP